MKSLIALLFFLPLTAHAFDDPTRGKPFLPWAWEDQFKPALERSLDTGGLAILGGGIAGTVAAHQYDIDVFEHNAKGEHLLMNRDLSGTLSTIGGGGLSVLVPAVLLFVDQKNALKVARAVTMTTLSHLTISAIVQRPRPAGRSDYLPFASSFPSGHASSAFALAGSLGDAYGWVAGVPATALALAISVGRVSENAHWLSDVIAGSALGLFWAHASNNVDRVDPTAWQWAPAPVEGGLLLSATKAF